MWTHHENFLNIIKEAQRSDVGKSPTFNLVNKLKKLRGELRKLNKDSFWQIFKRVNEARKSLDDIYKCLQANPLNEELGREEKIKLETFRSF